MEKSEERNALCEGATGSERQDTGMAQDNGLTMALASMAIAMASLMEPTEAEKLNEAAAKLMEGGNDGNA